MTGVAMERREAELLARSIVGRLRPVGEQFELPGAVLSNEEVLALRLLADMQQQGGTPGSKMPSGGEPAVKLEFDCLSSSPPNDVTLCIDFGTAYSKAAIWRQGAPNPVPLDLGKGADPTTSNVLLDSVAYVTGDRLLFGTAALRAFNYEDDPDRQLFDSPKELLTHEIARLEVRRPEKAKDPTGLFTSRDLLTLYLGYLTAVVCEALPEDVPRYVKRRYAAPGWNDAQADLPTGAMGAAARSLGELLVDAQILADTIGIDEWRNGLDVKRAASIMLALRVSRASKPIGPIPMVERAVLEAVAAGAGMMDRFRNRRPQVLVVDVGAGTTDVGFFRYSMPNKGDAIVAPYAGGMKAVKKAGHAVDDALRWVAARNVGLPAESDAMRRFQRRLSRSIRGIKAQLCEDGAVEIAIPDAPVFEIELEQLVNAPLIKTFVGEFRDAVTSALTGSGRRFDVARDDNVVVFSGGGRSLPFLRGVFVSGLKTDGGYANFLQDDALPSWVGRTVPDVTSVFPQIAVATGGCSPDLPTELQAVSDTHDPGSRSLTPFYKQ
jgi:hypothetical protein